MTNNYVCRQLTPEVIASTRIAWISDLRQAPNIFPPDVPQTLDFAANNNNYEVPGDEIAYGIFDESDASVAVAIVKMVISQSGKKWIKMLDCILRPIIAEKALASDVEAIYSVVMIYMEALTGSVHAASTHRCSLVKIYGRVSPLLEVITAVATELRKKENVAPGVSIQGRWLVLDAAKIKDEA